MYVMGLYLGEKSNFKELLDDNNLEIRNKIALECLSLQQVQLNNLKLSKNEMIDKNWNYMFQNLEIHCQGRYAKARLDRAIIIAEKFGIEVI